MRASIASPRRTRSSEKSHFFDPANPGGSTRAIFSGGGSSTGLGDITFRLKGTFWRGENGALALAADVRTPTGDEYNFLGTGAWGFKPFLIASYRVGRIAPHGNLGFQWNGASALAGDLTAGTKRRLPRQMPFAVGADVGLTGRVTFTFDLLGARVFNGPRVTRSTFRDARGTTFENITLGRGSFNLLDFSGGFKVNLGGSLLLTANVITRLNDSGLRARVIPLVGLSYTF